MRFSVEDFSQPISDDSPCGEDLEYDNAFALMETALQSQEEREMGDERVEASGPNWEAVGEHALDLLERTRDLRVLVNLAMAALNTGGVVGFHKGLQLINNNMEAHWEPIHPVLDPDDDNDPMMRMNVLQNLNDYALVRQGIWRAPLVELKGVGQFSLRDIDMATGSASPDEGEEATNLAIISGAFIDGDRDMVTAVAEATQGCLDELDRMAALWSEKTDGYEQPDSDGAAATLKDIVKALAEHAPAGTVESDDLADAEDAATDGGAAPVAAAPGTINSDADVIKAIDRICDYYAKNEPSSPIPVLLRRAQRLVSKDFYEILADIAPRGIDDFEYIRGQGTQDE